ncbi:hypothetical protein ASD04_11845 [Devosia sp. Root436]|uniref:hypothetical protein n=1 Tax=Devosia sp. Root436 TaxID=1736537 RepID=UPI0006F202A8|nr:hypothetical protein [Devosia sp. Root436]KQX38293.1 hypothetical protein ASD04_11845 [Devosia sp. Root436]
MTTQTSHPPFAPGAQGQPAAQAAPNSPPPREGYTTKPQAERHEALWLSLAALHKDTIALGAKKPTAPVSDALRISAEGLLSDCAEFIRQRGERLPVAAPDLAGLAVQLGRALAALESWESHHTTWDERFNCRIWHLHAGYLPIMRLKPPAAALKFKRDDLNAIRVKLDERFTNLRLRDFYNGFRAGRQTERESRPLAAVEAEWQKTYPRLRLFE